MAFAHRPTLSTLMITCMFNEASKEGFDARRITIVGPSERRAELVFAYNTHAWRAHREPLLGNLIELESHCEEPSQPRRAGPSAVADQDQALHARNHTSRRRPSATSCRPGVEELKNTA